jgi:hypothetical protein
MAVSPYNSICSFGTGSPPKLLRLMGNQEIFLILLFVE